MIFQIILYQDNCKVGAAQQLQVIIISNKLTADIITSTSQQEWIEIRK